MHQNLTMSQALLFTNDELELLARTADALSAYLGKPVLAEVMDASETGFEWVMFAIPLGTDDDDSELTIVQIGGANSRLLGSQGGLNIAANETYSCQFLWAVQLSDIENVRYIKLDDQGDDVAWSNDLNDLLPFQIEADVYGDDDEDNNDTDDDFDPARVQPNPNPDTLH